MAGKSDDMRIENEICEPEWLTIKFIGKHLLYYQNDRLKAANWDIQSATAKGD